MYACGVLCRHRQHHVARTQVPPVYLGVILACLVFSFLSCFFLWLLVAINMDTPHVGVFLFAILPGQHGKASLETSGLSFGPWRSSILYIFRSSCVPVRPPRSSLAPQGTKKMNKTCVSRSTLLYGTGCARATDESVQKRESPFLDQPRNVVLGDAVDASCSRRNPNPCYSAALSFTPSCNIPSVRVSVGLGGGCSLLDRGDRSGPFSTFLCALTERRVQRTRS